MQQPPTANPPWTNNNAGVHAERRRKRKKGKRSTTTARHLVAEGAAGKTKKQRKSPASIARSTIGARCSRTPHPKNAFGTRSTKGTDSKQSAMSSKSTSNRGVHSLLNSAATQLATIRVDQRVTDGVGVRRRKNGQ